MTWFFDGPDGWIQQWEELPLDTAKNRAAILRRSPSYSDVQVWVRL